ncbi:MAG TPA: acyl-CoA synthetase [Halothiobacillus sp.]|nr:MAG: acyl-CoA synthetase [Halothiobacillus sp. 20-54-6]HQT43031.1 acyl-CoA synthetase [Halothiobacillus sp.]
MSNPANATWQGHPERGSQFMLRLMLWLSRHLGRRLSRWVLYPIALYFLLFVPAARRASQTYLARIFGRPARGIEVFRHFFAFASTVHDRVYLLDRHHDLFEIEFVNQELFDSPQGAIVIGAHFGSFEALRSVGKINAKRRVSMLMYPENARKINALLALVDPEAVDDIIPLGQVDSMLTAQSRLETGHLVGMLADRSLPQDILRKCLFLGAPAAFALGPFRVAALLKKPVYFMAGLYLGGNRYRVHFEQLADFSETVRADRNEAIMSAQDHYVEILESLCRSAPYNWFNFYDFWAPPPSSHKREPAA